MLRKTIHSFLLTLLMVAVSLSQSVDETVLEANPKNPIEIDEFGRLGDCETSARLDVFLTELNQNPIATGYIITYQGKDALPADYNVSVYERIFRNYILLRNFDASRLTFVRGGFRDELSTELWLVPNGADPPEPTQAVDAPVMPTDKTFLYDKNYVGSDESYDYYNYLDEFILPSVKARMEEEVRIAEEEAQAERANSDAANENEVETVEQKSENEAENVEDTPETQEPTPEEIEEAKFSWVNETFGETIKKQKGASGVIIFYADDTYYDVGRLQSLFERGKLRITEANKISTTKIQVVYGGYRNGIEAEFWIVPKKGQTPAATPEDRPVEEMEIESVEN